MRGAEKIIQMRLKGRKPSVINLWDYPAKWELEPTEVVVHGIHATKLDLRFVFDCLVTITSKDRCKELERLCLSNGAKQVVAGPWNKFY